MRRTIVDTGATIVYFTTFAGLTEYFIAGMDPAEVLTTRLVMVPLMVLTARPYGLWRDTVFRRVSPSSGWAKTALDVVAFVSFQLPIYVATLIYAGADTREILILVAAVLPQMLILSRPFGIFLNYVRRVAGVAAGAGHPGTGNP